MTCKHNNLMCVNAVLIDKVCPVCLQAQLAQAVKVIEAAKQYKGKAEIYLPDLILNDYLEIEREFLEELDKFEGNES